jgi:hypothetical protein
MLTNVCDTLLSTVPEPDRPRALRDRRGSVPVSHGFRR